MTQPTSHISIWIDQLVEKRIKEVLFRAKVSEITADSVKIRRTYPGTTDEQSYAALDIWPFPEVDDEVLCAKVSEGYMVLGRILRDGLDVLHGVFTAEVGGNAQIVGTLLLAPGGSIQDADGSVWDQDTLKLVSAGAEGDSFIIAAGSVDQVYISADSSQNAIFGLTAAATTPTSLVLRDGDLILGFEGLSFNTLRSRIQITTLGVAITGNTAPDFASGNLGLFLADALVNPTGTPVGGGILFNDAGTLKWRTSGGNTRTVALV